MQEFVTWWKTFVRKIYSKKIRKMKMFLLLQSCCLSVSQSACVSGQPVCLITACLPACLAAWSLSVCLSVCLSIYLWLYSPVVGPWLFFNLLILYTVGRTPWTEHEPVIRPLRTHRTTQTQNKRTQTSMSWVGFESTIPSFERANRAHALDVLRSVPHCRYCQKLSK
jgi:hypothetical protein